MSRIFDTLKKFPSTDFHELNLDWIIKKIKDLDTMFHDIQVTSFNGRKGDIVPKSGDYSTSMITGLNEALAEFDETIDKIEYDFDNMKFLGYTIPKEMPIRNYKDSNGFHQVICRVDLGSLEWSYSLNAFRTPISDIGAVARSTNAYCSEYTLSREETDKTYYFGAFNIAFFNSTYESVEEFKNAMNGIFLYYELEIPIVYHEGSENTINSIFDTWKNNKTYTINDIVLFNNSTYVCILGNTNTVPTDSTHWGKISLNALITNLLNR